MFVESFAAEYLILHCLFFIASAELGPLHVSISPHYLVLVHSVYQLLANFFHLTCVYDHIGIAPLHQGVWPEKN